MLEEKVRLHFVDDIECRAEVALMEFRARKRCSVSHERSVVRGLASTEGDRHLGERQSTVGRIYRSEKTQPVRIRLHK